MYTTPVHRLAEMDFSDLGAYYNAIEPTGFHMGNCYHDKVIFPVSGNMPLSFSTFIVEKPPEMIVSAAEHNAVSPKVILPLDGDIICYAAPASRVVYPALLRAFLVPKGTLVRLNPGVWHRNSFAAQDGKVHVLVVQPQLTHMLDNTLVEFPVGDWVEIVDEQ